MMSDPEVTRLVYEGALAVRAGRREAARDLLLAALERDEQNADAWLWLSGAVEDPSDQQVALENALAVDPNNRYALAGLDWLATSPTVPSAVLVPAAAVSTGEWTPPPPMDDNDVAEFPCWQCGSVLYSVAPFCWQCNAPVHACRNCAFMPEQRCKELQGLISPVTQQARNECPWWRPAIVS